MRRAGSDGKIQVIRMYNWVQNETADCRQQTTNKMPADYALKSLLQ